ncbi:hypothetical protein B0H14DRAFT_2615349 [Mycena olivaceomarginata]|nr:hypothetical protein B0H14DRAFT_2615349 [Mycena olivaceomarginata]
MPLMPEQAAACREWQGKGAHYNVHQAWQARRHFVICTCGPARAYYNGTTWRAHWAASPSLRVFAPTAFSSPSIFGLSFSGLCRPGFCGGTERLLLNCVHRLSTRRECHPHDNRRRARADDELGRLFTHLVAQREIVHPTVQEYSSRRREWKKTAYFYDAYAAKECHRIEDRRHAQRNAPSDESLLDNDRLRHGLRLVNALPDADGLAAQIRMRLPDLPFKSTCCRQICTPLGRTRALRGMHSTHDLGYSTQGWGLSRTQQWHCPGGKQHQRWCGYSARGALRAGECGYGTRVWPPAKVEDVAWRVAREVQHAMRAGEGEWRLMLPAATGANMMTDTNADVKDTVAWNPSTASRMHQSRPGPFLPRTTSITFRMAAYEAISVYISSAMLNTVPACWEVTVTVTEGPSRRRRRGRVTVTMAPSPKKCCDKNNNLEVKLRNGPMKHQESEERTMCVANLDNGHDQFQAGRRFHTGWYSIIPVVQNCYNRSKQNKRLLGRFAASHPLPKLRGEPRPGKDLPE